MIMYFCYNFGDVIGSGSEVMVQNIEKYTKDCVFFNRIYQKQINIALR